MFSGLGALEFSWIVRHKLAVSLTTITILVIYVAYLGYLDTKRDPVTLDIRDATSTALLQLQELETSGKQIKAYLQVPAFKAGEDTLQLASAKIAPDHVGLSRTKLISFAAGVTPDKKGPWYEFNLPYSSIPFFYPFEHYDIDLYLQLLKCNSGDTPLKLLVINYVDDLNIDSVGAGYSFEESTKSDGAYHIRLARHRFVKTVAEILFIVAFVFLLYIALKEETSKVPANSLGYLAALWGIRQIIVGSVKLFLTIIDYTTLALYMIVALIVVYKLWSDTKNTPARKYGRRPFRPMTVWSRATGHRGPHRNKVNRWQFYE